jgi:hypothetical protein
MPCWRMGHFGLYIIKRMKRVCHHEFGGVLLSLRLAVNPGLVFYIGLGVH